MIPPFGCIGHFILAAALLGKFIQVHAFLQLQVISDPVVRIVIAVSVRGDTVCCQENAAAGLGIRNSSRPGTLVILISAINIDDMIRIGIHFQNTGVESVFNDHRNFDITGKYYVISKYGIRALILIQSLFNAGLTEDRIGGRCFAIETDGIGVLF